MQNSKYCQPTLAEARDGSCFSTKRQLRLRYAVDTTLDELAVSAGEKPTTGNVHQNLLFLI